MQIIPQVTELLFTGHEVCDYKELESWPPLENTLERSVHVKELGKLIPERRSVHRRIVWKIKSWIYFIFNLDGGYCEWISEAVLKLFCIDKFSFSDIFFVINLFRL